MTTFANKLHYSSEKSRNLYSWRVQTLWLTLFWSEQSLQNLLGLFLAFSGCNSWNCNISLDISWIYLSIICFHHRAVYQGATWRRSGFICLRIRLQLQCVLCMSVRAAAAAQFSPAVRRAEDDFTHTPTTKDTTRLFILHDDLLIREETAPHSSLVESDFIDMKNIPSKWQRRWENQIHTSVTSPHCKNPLHSTEMLLK